METRRLTAGSDYERVTMPLLYEDVSYDEAVIALSEIAAFLKANWILPNIIRLKSDQNVKTSRKNVAENPGEALWMRSWRALPPACGRVDCGCVSGRRALRFNRNISRIRCPMIVANVSGTGG